jgi:hypothetical protein
VTASLRVDRGRVTVSLRNETDAPVRIPRALLAPALAFEVKGEDGSPVALGPPPVPTPDVGADTAIVDPGESLELDYATSELFGGAPPAGRYRVRFAVGDSPPDGTRLESPWVELGD